MSITDEDLENLLGPEGHSPGGRTESDDRGTPDLGTKSVLGWDDLAGHIGSRFTKRDSAEFAAKRRAYPISCYIGANGSGKSLAMIHDSLPSLEAGRPILSTVRILDYKNPRPCPGGSRCDSPEYHDISHTRMVQDPDDPTHWYPETVDTHSVHAAAHPLYVRLHSFQQLLDFRGGDVLFDEVTGIASSRESQSMPAPILNWMMQLRRIDCSLRWTAPAWPRADKGMREVTQLVTNCMGGARVKRTDETGTRQWRDSRSFVWASYDAQAFDEFTSAKKEKLPRSVLQRFWRPGSQAELAYDTRDSVDSLSVSDSSGNCLRCGGYRARPKCPGH